MFFSIQSFFSNYQVAGFSGWDIFVAILFLIAVLIYGFFLGRNRIVTLLLTAFLSLMILQSIPWVYVGQIKFLGLKGEPSSSLKIFIFLALAVLFFFLMPRSVLSSGLKSRVRGEASWIQLFILGFLQVGFVAMVIFSFLPEEAISIAPIVKKVFIGREAQFLWTTLSILGIVLMRRKRKIED